MIENCLLRTLAWWDLLHYPLTSVECWYYLYQTREGLTEVTLVQVEQALKSLAAAGRVQSAGGFWQLGGTPSYRQARLERARWAVFKRGRAIKGAKLFSYLPFVRLVGLVNTVAMEVPKAGSDIDLFIVVQPGRLWLGRLLVVLAAHWRGWRQYGHYVRDRLCLSFLVTEDKLNLEPLAYADDPYFKFWISSVRPLLDQGVYSRWQTANSWVGESLPNYSKCLGREADNLFGLGLIDRPCGSGLVQRIIEALFRGQWGEWCEQLARQLQWPRLERYLGSKLNDGTGAVVVNEQIMKLHLNDRRLQLAAAFAQRLSQLDIV